MNFKKITIPLLISITLAFLTNCNFDTLPIIAHSTAQSYSTVSIALSPSLDSQSPFFPTPHHPILTITADDMEDLITTLPATASSIKDTTLKIPAGKNRFFALSVFDTLDSLRYYGSTRADLPRGSTVNVSITLYKAGALPTDSGTIQYPIIPADNQILYLPFNGNADDISGESHNGTVSGAQLTADRWNTVDRSFHFDGINDGITIEDIDLTNSFTISLWIKPDTFFTRQAFIIEKMGRNNSDNYSVYINNKTIGAAITIGEPHPAPATYYSVQADLNENSHWYFISVVYNDSTEPGRLQLYIDGTCRDSCSVVRGPLRTNNEPVELGIRDGKSDFAFAGAIDDIHFYTRPLVSVEIQSLFHENGWPGKKTIPANLSVSLPAELQLVYLPFSQNAIDSSGNGYTVKVNGASASSDRFNISASAFYFSGNDNIAITSPSDFNFIMQPFTISVWVKPSDLKQNHCRVIDHIAAGTGNGYGIDMTNTDVQYLSSSANAMMYAFKEGIWYHLTSVFNGSTVKFFVNGELLEEHSVSHRPLAGDLIIGAARDGTAGFIGSIDDVRVYLRELSAEEIKMLAEN